MGKQTLLVLGVLAAIGCDKAKTDYDRCLAETERGNISGAQAACSAAVKKDPESPSGENARIQLDRLAEKEAAAKKKAEEEAAAKKKAEEEARLGIEVDSTTLVRAFMSDQNAANKRYLNKRVRTSGKVTETRWVADGNLNMASVGSDAEGQVSGILCKLDSSTPQDVRAALEVGSTVKVVGVVEKFFEANIDLGGMSQLTINPCKIVK